MDQIPIFSVDLIEALNLSIPEASPDPDLSDKELWMRAGERRVVRALVARARQLKELNILES